MGFYLKNTFFISISIFYFDKVGFIIIPIATSISSWINAFLLFLNLSQNDYFKLKNILNIPNLKILDQEGTNPYDLLKYKNVIFTTSSIKLFQERVSK